MIKLSDLSSKQADSRALFPSLIVQPRIELILLIIVICIAAFFRLYRLGEPAFRADTMVFMDFARQPIGIGEFFTQWTSTLGLQKTGQFPFAVAWMKLFLNVTGVPLTPFMIRLPSALWGILAVLAVYGCGRVLAGNGFALFLAALFALNPFHIGISREAYYYPPLVCGSAFFLWAIFLQIKADRDRGLLPGVFYVLLAAGFFLTTYSQPSAWPFAFIAVLTILWFQIRIAWRIRRIPGSLCWIALILAVIGIPLFFADWALPQMIASSSPAHKAYIVRVFGTEWEPIYSLLARTLFSFCWGKTLPRILFTIVVLLLSIAVTVRLWRRSLVMPVLFILLAGGIILYVTARYLLVAAVSSRYLLAFLPLYLIWLAFGVWFASDALSVIKRRACLQRYAQHYGQVAAAVSIGIMIIALGLNVWPARLATQLTGKPIPYWDIVRWCDKNLPPRSLVLVERWLDPWNELRIHNSTNVYFTFPVPSEPNDVFEQMNWPLAARQFMEKFPDAVYLEFSKAGRQRMGLVTNWSFARSVSFTNEAAVKLAQLGAAHREEFFTPQADRLINTIFYNTREDVIEQARHGGKQYLVLYGPEWGYVKLWQQLRDFRDWRILENQASLDVYNLTSSTNRVTLKMRGMAMNGMKRVSAADGSASGGESGEKYRDFRHLQLEEWELKDILLKPGFNRIVFSDSLWSVAKIPLLVDQIEVSPSRP